MRRQVLESNVGGNDCMYRQRWARSTPFSDLEDQRSDHLSNVILKIKITLLLVLKDR